MKTKLVVPFALSLLFLLTNLTYFLAPTNESLILYKQVISGKRNLDSLTPQQQSTDVYTKLFIPSLKITRCITTSIL